MIKYILHSIVLSLAFMILSACGGGGGGSETPETPGTKTTATLKISLGGIPNGTLVAGTEFTLTLPANVAPDVDSFGNPTSIFVTNSGTFSLSSIAPVVSYIKAVVGSPGKVYVILANSADNAAGEVATIVLQLANGATPAATDFGLNNPSVKVIDRGGNPISGATAAVGVTLQ